MRVITQLFLGYLAVLAVAAFFLVQGAIQEIKPAMRQSAEETLVDTANLLAELVRDDFLAGHLDDSRFAEALHAYTGRRLNAEIYAVAKAHGDLHVYVTDAHGIVVFDSEGRAKGADYSRWNDVYKTLRGEYGARSTPLDPADEHSTVMYVAAPIKAGPDIKGVLTVGKRNASVQPFIDRSVRRIVIGAAITVLGTAALAVLLSFWLSRAIAKLVRYAETVSAGGRVALPRLRGPELQKLGTAIEEMREKLEGKAYAEQYAQALTHELKSPLAGIRASAELIEDGLPAADAQRFAKTIRSECQRLLQVIERLLGLARVEHRQTLQDPTDVPLHALVEELRQAHAAALAERRLVLVNDIGAGCSAHGERFLLQQALENLLANAIDFTPVGGRIAFGASEDAGEVLVACRNSGPGIPDYALPRLGERFFSLPRPDTGRKSSGLGLNLVRQIAELHGGRFEIGNEADGVSARLVLPRA